MHDLILKSTGHTVIDTAFNFDHVTKKIAPNGTTPGEIEGNTATYDVSAVGGSIVIDVSAIVTDGSSSIYGYVAATY